MFVFACAVYNLVRLRNLQEATARRKRVSWHVEHSKSGNILNAGSLLNHLIKHDPCLREHHEHI